MTMPWDFALILAFLAAVVPFLGRRRMRDLMRLPETTKLDRLTLYASTVAFQWLAAAVVVWRASARGVPSAQLGLAIPNPAATAVSAAALSLLLSLNQLVSLRHLARAPTAAEGMVVHLARKIFPQDGIERLAFFALVATVALCEEFVYRGFAQYVFQAVSGNMVWAGILGSSVMFGLAHLYQGRKGLVSTFAVGVVFSLVRAWTGSLCATAIAHFAADITVGFLAPIKLRQLAKDRWLVSEAKNHDSSSFLLYM